MIYPKEFHIISLVTNLHTMGAFWSSTDNANENATQFYGVYGEIFKPETAFLFRYVHGSDKTDIPASELFDMPKVITHVDLGNGQTVEIQNNLEYKGPWPEVEYPEDWMGQHTAAYSYYKAPASGHAHHGARYDDDWKREGYGGAGQTWQGKGPGYWERGLWYPIKGKGAAATAGAAPLRYRGEVVDPEEYDYSRGSNAGHVETGQKKTQ